jgi:hypothetical protein
MDLVVVVEKLLNKALQLNDTQDDFIFSSEKLTQNVAYLINNYITKRKQSTTEDPTNQKIISDFLRILTPHGFNGVKFKDNFGIKDVLDDISLYRRGFCFLYYELTEIQHDSSSWKLTATYLNLDTAFLTNRNIFPEKHHITKTYYKILPPLSKCQTAYLCKKRNDSIAENLLIANKSIISKALTKRKIELGEYLELDCGNDVESWFIGLDGILDKIVLLNLKLVTIDTSEKKSAENAHRDDVETYEFFGKRIFPSVVI